MQAMEAGRPSDRATPIRCAIYTRKSTTIGLEQEFNSLDAQWEACSGFVRRQEGWTLVDERYDDGGFTGASADRPAFQRLLADVDAGKIDIVVVYKVDRLSRSLLDFAKLAERLAAGGASFVSVTQNFSTADAMGRLTLNMLMSFAEFEREMIAERTRDKIGAMRRKGRWTGGPPPFGYRARGKRLEVDEREALTVREAFSLMLQQRQIAMVGRTLNERGLLRMVGPEHRRRAAHWTKDSVPRMLRNPIYIGQMTLGKERWRGEQAALVDPDTFEAVQRILNGLGPNVRFEGINHEYTLRGLLRCSLCGQAMIPLSTANGSGASYRYYRCPARGRKGVGPCAVGYVSAAAIEGFVLDRLAEAWLGAAFEVEVRQAIEMKAKEHHAKSAALHRLLPVAIASHAANAANLVEELPRLSGRQRVRAETNLKAETQMLAAAEHQLAVVEQGLLAVERVLRAPQSCAAQVAHFPRVWDMMTVVNRGRLLRAVIDRVDFNKKTGRVAIHVFDFGQSKDTAGALPHMHVPDAVSSLPQK
jgi:DNA invertase Pin-like site-specific DNA recombinase